MRNAQIRQDEQAAPAQHPGYLTYSPSLVAPMMEGYGTGDQVDRLALQRQALGWRQVNPVSAGSLARLGQPALDGQSRVSQVQVHPEGAMGVLGSGMQISTTPSQISIYWRMVRKQPCHP